LQKACKITNLESVSSNVAGGISLWPAHFVRQTFANRFRRASHSSILT
jgi:hypothetical protein